MNIFENLENLNVSEECFNDIMGIVEELLNENSVDTYYKNKLNNINQELAKTKALKRHLNKTVDKKVNKEYKKAAGIKRAWNDDLQRIEQNAISRGYDLEDEQPDYYKNTVDAYNKASDAKETAASKFSKEGNDAYHKILDLKSKRDHLKRGLNRHNRHVEDSKSPSKHYTGLRNGSHYIQNTEEIKEQ